MVAGGTCGRYLSTLAPGGDFFFHNLLKLADIKSTIT